MSNKIIKASIIKLHKVEMEMRILNELIKQGEDKNNELKNIAIKVGGLLADIWSELKILEKENEFKENQITAVCNLISKTALKVACTLEEKQASFLEAKGVFLKKTVRTRSRFGFGQRKFEVFDILSWPDEGLVSEMKKELLIIIASL